MRNSTIFTIMVIMAIFGLLSYNWIVNEINSTAGKNQLLRNKIVHLARVEDNLTIQYENMTQRDTIIAQCRRLRLNLRSAKPGQVIQVRHFKDRT